MSEEKTILEVILEEIEKINGGKEDFSELQNILAKIEKNYKKIIEGEKANIAIQLFLLLINREMVRKNKEICKKTFEVLKLLNYKTADSAESLIKMLNE